MTGAMGEEECSAEIKVSLIGLRCGPTARGEGVCLQIAEGLQWWILQSGALFLLTVHRFIRGQLSNHQEVNRSLKSNLEKRRRTKVDFKR